MANYIQRSPWVSEVDDLGAVFGRLMLNMAQLRAAENAQAQNLGFQREKMAAEMPLLRAQTEAQAAGAALDKAKTGELEMLGRNAQDAGLSQFANIMSSVPGYNPLGQSMLQDTAQTRQALARALLGQQLTQSAATSPTAAASMLRPVELNRDADLVSQLTGALLASGPRSPEPLINLGPQEGAYNRAGTQVAFNPAVRMGVGDDPAIQQRLLAALGLNVMQELGKPVQDEMGFPKPGVKLADTIPGMGDAYTNALTLLGRNLATLTGGTNAPVAATPQYKEGDVVRDKQGNRLQLKNNKWQPIP